ncbi:uncharacterized protein [Palaemon carinicauda]
MLGGCLYHILDYLIPHNCDAAGKDLSQESSKSNTSRSDTCDDFSSLKYLSACKILEDFGLANRLLPHLPPMLYPAVFHALAQKQFNAWNTSNCRPHEASSLSLISIIDNWPFQEMIVRDLMPIWCNPVSRTNAKRRTLTQLQEDLNQFIYNFFILVFHKYLKRFDDDEKPEEKYTLSKLDLSGFNGFLCDRVGFNMLEKQVKNAYNPNSSPDYHKSELVIDVRDVQLDKEMLNLLGVVCTLSQHHGAGLVVKFRTMNIWSSFSKDIIPVIQILSKNNATEYLELVLCILTDEAVNKLCLMSKTLVGLSLAYCRGFSSLQFVPLLSNLCQLDLSGTQFSGKLEPLRNLPQGLKYLKLVGSGMTPADLELLAESHHVKSLLQLDLSENTFNHPTKVASLCILCQKLSKILVLELQNCKLNQISQENLRVFIDIMKTLPELQILRLTDNDFYSRIIKEELPHLASSSTLRYLCLTVPSDAYLSDDYNVTATVIKRLQYDFTQHVQTFSRNFNVEWKENIEYSHWYYAI